MASSSKSLLFAALALTGPALFAEAPSTTVAIPAAVEKASFVVAALDQVEAGLLLTDIAPKVVAGCQLALKALRERGIYSQTGPDAENRPIFVSVQEGVERFLASGLKAKTLSDVQVQFFTPLPATPLCSEGAVMDAVASEAVLQDKDRLRTLTGRVESVRLLLSAGAEVQSIYPKGGLEKRPIASQNIYRGLLAEFSNLKDIPSDEPVSNFVGAIYRFKDVDSGQAYVFEVQATQAMAPSDNTVWTLSLKPVQEV